MGLWRGDRHFGGRHDCNAEYVRILRDLWSTGLSDFKGEFLRMGRCVLSPRPSKPIKPLAAGQSDRGMEFAAQYCDDDV